MGFHGPVRDFLGAPCGICSRLFVHRARQSLACQGSQEGICLLDASEIPAFHQVMNLSESLLGGKRMQ